MNFISLMHQFNILKVIQKQFLNCFCWTITTSNQNYFRWRSINRTKVKIIFIFSYNCKRIFFGKFPNSDVRFFIQILKFCMCRIWINFFQSLYKFSGKISIKEKFQSDYHSSNFSICQIGKASKNVFFCQFWKIIQYLLRRHSRSKVFQNIVNSNPESSNARFSKSLSWLNSYNLTIINFFHSSEMLSISAMSSENSSTILSRLYGEMK